MVSFSIFKSLANAPRYVASRVGGYLWGSVGADPEDLRHIDVDRRRSYWGARLPIRLIDWFNYARPWDGYAPYPVFAADDILRWLGDLPKGHWQPQTRGGVRVGASFRVGLAQLSEQLERACKDIVDHVFPIFDRYGEREPDAPFTPYTVTREELDTVFESAEEGLNSVQEWQARLLSNVGFLAWFTASMDSWKDCMGDETREFIISLALESRPLRGYLINLAVDYPWIDIAQLIEHEVPFHYIWTPAAHFDSRYLRAYPFLVARTLEWWKQKGVEPTDDDILQGQGDLRAVWEYDRLFQCTAPEELPDEIHPDDRRGPLPTDCAYTIRLYEDWHEFETARVDVVSRVADRYAVGRPRRPLVKDDSRKELRVYAWLAKGASKDTRTPKERAQDPSWRIDETLFDLPEVMTRGKGVNGREMRRYRNAPYPEEMLRDENVTDDEDKVVQALEEQILMEGLWKDSPIPSRTGMTAEGEWERVRAFIPAIEYDSSKQYDTIPEIETEIGPEDMDVDRPEEAKSKPTLIERLSTPTARPVGTLRDRIGQRVPDNWRPPEERTRAQSSRERQVTAAAGPSRRSASPERQGTPSPSLLARFQSTSTVELGTSISSRNTSELSLATDLLPPSSSRLIPRHSKDWSDAWSKMKQQLSAIGLKLTGQEHPRARLPHDAVTLAEEVKTDGYLFFERAQDCVRFWIWMLENPRARAELLIEKAICAGIPLTIMLPVTYYTIEPPRKPVSDRESHHIEMVEFGQGGTNLFRRWVSGVKDIARRPHAAAIYLKGGYVARVLERWAADELPSDWGKGPCLKTRDTFAGKLLGPGAPVPKLFSDYASTEEINYLLGTMKAIPGQGKQDENTVRSAFPPADLAENPRLWPSCGEWTVEEEKFFQFIADKFEHGRWSLPSRKQWREVLRDRARSRRPRVELKDLLDEQVVDDWRDYLGRAYAADPSYLPIASLGDIGEPTRLFYD
ncbi:hypothetical protein K523DRAFT_358407 [Schizophyllum commune Tattone D]|nr:hypothetical protein K523DRAFT_358407 [Schizophyllum commune Tattone D]